MDKKDKDKNSLFSEADTLKLHGGHYRIEKLIGKGGMGKIYKAYDPLLKRFVAVKFLWDVNLETSEAVLIKGMLTFLKAKNAADQDQKKKLTTQANEFITRAFEMNALLKQKYKAF
jgi:hypothetical protein